MTSDKDDDLDLGTDMDEAIDIIDVEGIDEPLSASPLGGADEYDADGDDEFADESEQIQRPRKKSGGMTKIMAPLLVLLAAAGAGGYIVMNPAILGGAPTQVVTTEITPPSGEVAMLPPPDVPAETVPQVAATDMPPPPLPNTNEMAPVLAEVPVTDGAVPEITAETPVPDITAETIVPAEAPLDPTATPAQVDSMEVVTGSDVAVSPEALSMPVEAPAMAPGIAPEMTPEVAPAPEIAPTPEVATVTPEVSPVPEPLVETPVVPEVAAVTEPTFVPAAPDGQASVVTETVVTETVVTDAAAPPVMNVQEITGATAPEMPPVTTSTTTTTTTTTAAPTTTPGAAGGQAAAPVTPLPPANANNVYYDSLAQVPTGAMATSVGPREINPVLEPASKMVIVSKDRNESSEEALLVAANRALKLKRYDSALEMYDQLYAKNKRDVRILMGRAIAQQNMGLSESAVLSYEEVLALSPNNTEALVNMMGLVRKQYPEVALRRLLELYAKHPNNAGIAAQIGITNAGLGHFDDAMRFLGIASTLEPQNAQHLFNMAIAADRQGNGAQAIQLYERALEVDVMYGASRSVPRESIYDRLSVLRRG